MYAKQHMFLLKICILKNSQVNILTNTPVVLYWESVIIIMFIKPKGWVGVEKDKVKISTPAKNVGRVQSVARSVLGTFISATDRMILIF